MKKLVILLILFCLILSACSEKSKEAIQENSILRTEETIFRGVKNYLPIEITNDVPDFKETVDTDTIVYKWSKSQIDSKETLHSITVITTDHEITGVMCYSGHDGWTENRIAKEAAFEIVKNFAKENIRHGEELLFDIIIKNPGVNEPDYEGWTAERDDKEYTVIVNLKYGYLSNYEVIPCQ